MNIEDLPDDSDSSDEDYLPESKPEEIPSEVESDGDPEDDLSGDEDKSRGKKRKQKTTKKRKKQKTNEDTTSELCEEKAEKEIPQEEKKEDIDDIWADFMKDTGFQGKNTKVEDVKKSPVQTSGKKTLNINKTTTEKKDEKVKIQQVFQFAGEEVTIEKEVPVHSAEARLFSKTSNSESTTQVKPKRTGGGLSGIGSVLSQLGKKPKISTLEKTKLDWDRYKKEENIEEELRTHNKGKDGYLERQDFLERADLRRFEIEREVRSVERSKRVNNV